LQAVHTDFAELTEPTRQRKVVRTVHKDWTSRWMSFADFDLITTECIRELAELGNTKLEA
jgi:hypothetical protein